MFDALQFIFAAVRRSCQRGAPRVFSPMLPISDNINTNGFVDQTPTTYNQGTFIGAADFLGQTNDALLAANYTMTSMSGAGYLPRYGIAQNNSIFNSIFIRLIYP